MKIVRFCPVKLSGQLNHLTNLLRWQSASHSSRYSKLVFVIGCIIKTGGRVKKPTVNEFASN